MTIQRWATLWAIGCLLFCACGGDDDDSGTDAMSGSGTGGSISGTGGVMHGGGNGEPIMSGGGAQNQGAGSGGHANGSGSGGSSGDAGSGSNGNVPSDAGGDVIAKAGNPDGKCSQPLPDGAKPADTSSPTRVIGGGSPASCTSEAVSAAVAQGGVITFDCGADPVTVELTATIDLPIDRDTVIDGGNKITLDGQDKVRILHWDSGNWLANDHSLTLQHIVLQHGRATPTEMIPTSHAPPCSQGYLDGQGGALLMRDGILHAIDVTFSDNHAADLGPDTGGGAVYLQGCKQAYVASCTFKGNSASNAGAIGSLFATDFIYDSLFEDNEATGHDANNVDTSKCSEMANQQGQIGSGGNGGAIYNDGAGQKDMMGNVIATKDVTICGCEIRNNKAGAFGAAVFFTSNDPSAKGTLTIRDTIMYNNVPADPNWQWKPGISTNADTPDPIDSDIRP